MKEQQGGSKLVLLRGLSLREATIPRELLGRRPLMQVQPTLSL
jgi:hypothetical protein